MPNTTKDLVTNERTNSDSGWPVAASAVLYRGAILGSVVVSNVRYARAYQPGDLILGVSEDYVDNATGANGAKTVGARRSCFKFAQNGTINGNHVDQFARALDDNLLALETVGTTQTVNTAGRIVQVDSDGVWIEMRRYLP